MNRRLICFLQCLYSVSCRISRRCFGCRFHTKIGASRASITAFNFFSCIFSVCSAKCSIPNFQHWVHNWLRRWHYYDAHCRCRCSLWRSCIDRNTTRKRQCQQQKRPNCSFDCWHLVVLLFPVHILPSWITPRPFPAFYKRLHHSPLDSSFPNFSTYQRTSQPEPLSYLVLRLQRRI